MFDDKEYIEVFSQVTASPKTRQEVMNMGKQRNTKHRGFGRRIAVLAAAVMLLTAMTVTAFASEEIVGWFRSYFDNRNGQTLSDKQIAYLEENEQIIGQAKAEDGWTVELRSVIHDEKMGYIILSVSGPEDVVIQPHQDENGNRVGDFNFGNFTTSAFRKNVPDLVTPAKGITFGSWGAGWAEDGDGRENTKYFVITLNPDFDKSSVEPFGTDASYTIHLEDIVWEYQNMLYYGELMNGEYAGSVNVMLTDAETQELYCEEILAEGSWDFTVSFASGENQSGEYVEMITAPVSTKATVYRRVGTAITDYAYKESQIQLTSVQLRHLTVSFGCSETIGICGLSAEDGQNILHPSVVLLDGREIRLMPYGSYSAGWTVLEAESPIVFEEVSHIRMADGTIIPMPETE